MPFIPITEAEIEPGKSVRSETLDKIRTNLDELDSRATALEGGTNTVYPPIIFRVNGPYSSLVGVDGVLSTTCNFNLTITGVYLICETAGSAGTTTVELEYKRGAGAWTAVCSTPPSLAHSAGNYAQSTNAVLDPANVGIQAGDFLRINLTSTQTAPKDFFVRVDFVSS